MVHMVMYLYYLLAAMGPKIQRKIDSYKKYITIIQMVRNFKYLRNSNIKHIQIIRLLKLVPNKTFYKTWVFYVLVTVMLLTFFLSSIFLWIYYVHKTNVIIHTILTYFIYAMHAAIHTMVSDPWYIYIFFFRYNFVFWLSTHYFIWLLTVKYLTFMDGYLYQMCLLYFICSTTFIGNHTRKLL